MLKSKLISLVIVGMFLFFIGRPSLVSAQEVSSEWEILEYSSDMGIGIDSAFIQNQTRPGTKVKYATVIIANFGEVKFKAQRKFSLKAGKKYEMNYLYGSFAPNGTTGYIEFNGEKIVASNQTIIDQPYHEVICPTVDMDYVITIACTATKGKGVSLVVGYDSSDPKGGFTEEEDTQLTSTTNPSEEDTSVSTENQAATNYTREVVASSTTRTSKIISGQETSSNSNNLVTTLETRNTYDVAASQNSGSENFLNQTKAELPKTNQKNSLRGLEMSGGMFLVSIVFFLFLFKKRSKNWK